MSFIYIQYYNSPFGELILGSYQDTLVLCDWKYRKMRDRIDRRIQDGLQTTYIEKKSDVIHNTIQQLQEYFESNRLTFDIPIKLIGTNFQKRVWKELMKIPYGQIETYLSLSEKLGDKNAIRAVATANGANAISILIPCHRIIGSNGQLIGYAGGTKAKEKLLQLEGVGLFANQLSMFETS